MNLKEAVVKACEFDSLSDALVSIALWETERIVNQAVRNTKEQSTNPDGSLYDTCFGRCFDAVLAEHPKALARKKDALVKLYLSNVMYVDGIYKYNNHHYYIIAQEIGLIDMSKLLSVEDLIDVELSVRAHQGRNISEMMSGAEKIWLKGED